MTDPIETTPLNLTPDQASTASDLASEQGVEAIARRPRRVRLWGGIAGGLVLLLGVGGFAAASAHKVGSIDVDGESLAFGSFGGSVSDLLEEKGVELGEHDEVFPALDASLKDGLDIQVLRAAPVDVQVDGKNEVLWTTASDAGAALASYSLEGRTAAMTVSRSTERSEMDLPLAPHTQLVADGATRTFDFPSATTLQTALEVAGLTLTDLDELTVTADAEGTSHVTIVRVAITERIENEVVAHASSEVKDSSRLVGTSAVTTAGVDGNIERRYQVTTRDGVEVAAELTSEVVTVAVVDEVVSVGTKPKPVVQAPAASTSSSSGSTSSSTGASTAPVATGDVWAALAQCESGGNPSAVSSSGAYHGLYQFSVATWKSVGGSGLPSQASAAEQTERAQILQARSGWGQWPACSRKIGVR
mgnify:FL=1